MAQLVARLVRNEKVGGSNPPSSTTGRHPIRMSVFCTPGRCCGGALLWRRWCSGRRRARPPARLGPHFVRHRASKPARALRSLRRPPHWRHLACWCVVDRAPPPPTGAAAWPRRRPSTRARVSAWTVTVAFNVARANLVCDFRQVLFIAILRRLHFAVFECVSPTGWLFRKGDVMVGDTWRQFPRFYLCMSLVTRRAIYGCE